MRKIFPFLAIAAAVAAATPALAEQDSVNPNYSNGYYAAPVAGALVGTAVGVGLYNGWYSGAFATALPATGVGAAAVGGVAGIGTVALIEGVTAHCHGFGILWTDRSECVNGQWIGDQPVVVHRRHAAR
jgi:hypothetical protein